MKELSFSSLTEDERSLLGLLAFRERKAKAMFKGFSKEFGIAGDKIEGLTAAIREYGYIDQNNTVEPELLIPVILNILECSPEKAAAYSKISDQDMRYAWFWKLCQDFLDGKLFHPISVWSQRIPESPLLYRYFIPVFLNRRYHPMLSAVPDRIFISLFGSTLDNGLENDDLTEELLNGMERVADGRLSAYKDEVSAHMKHRLRFIRYLYFGDTACIPQENDEWGLACRAVLLLYSGKTKDALKSFESAYSAHCSFNDRTYIFGNPILSFLFIAALLKMNDDSSDRRAHFLADRGLNYCHGASVLLRTLVVCGTMKGGDRQTAASEMLSKFNPETPLERQMKFLIGRWLGVRGLPPDFDMDDVHSAVMRHELNAYRDIPQEEEELVLCTPLGGPPVLGNIRRLEPWEQALQDASDSIPDSTLSDDGSDSRIVYNMDGTSLTSVDLQLKSLDGRWCPAERMTWQNFINFSHSAIDTSDKAVIVDLRVAQNERWARKPTFSSDAEIIIPHMAGTGRVFGPDGPVEIREIPPALTAKVKGDRIELTNNVSTDKIGNVKPCTVSGGCSKGFEVVRLDHRQMAVLQSLQKVKFYPLEAVDTLRNVFRQISPFMDVNDSALVSMTAAAESCGTPRLVVTFGFNEKYSSYSVKVQACPLEGGKTRFCPGGGGKDYIDKRGGENLIVHRDISGERANFDLLQNFIQNHMYLHFVGDTGNRLIGCADVLRLLEFLQDHSDKFVAEWPKGHSIRYRGKGRTSVWEVNGNPREEWFSVEGSISCQGSKVTIADVLKYLKTAREEIPEGFIQIGENEYAKISRQLMKQIERLQSMGTVSSGGDLHISKYQVGQLAKVLGQGNNVTAGPEFDDLKKRMEAAYGTEPVLPETLCATLRPYQKEGYQWMKRLDAWGAGACLADDMGLGKTLQSIAFMLSKADDGPSLVVAPTSVVPNWAEEVGRFAPGLRTVVLNHEKNREGVVREAAAGDVVLCTYGVLAGNADLLRDREWNVICLDEAHQIKNRFTKVSQAAMDLRGQSRLVLTGTPVQNNLMELWNLFQFINPGLLGSCEQFRQKYISAVNDDEGEALEVLKGMTQPFILRRTKSEVLDDLPAKTEMDWMVRMTDSETDIYEAMRETIEANLHAAGDHSKVDFTVLESLTKLRLAACSMSLLENNWSGVSSKIRDVKFLLGRILKGDNKVLVFSQFTSFLGLLKRDLEESGTDYLYLDGSTTMKERQRLVSEFQTGETKLFLVSLKAGGLGLNLTAANYVLLLDPWWNPAIENQAKDRAHRIGQKRDVTVIRMISSHTIEEKILRLHESKIGLSDNILEGTANSSKLTFEDVVEMVSPF